MPIDFPLPLDAEIAANVDAALSEDVGPGDLTAALIPAGKPGRARVISREAAVLCGTAWLAECVRQLDPGLSITWHAAEGDAIAPEQLLCEWPPRSSAS